MIIAPKSDVTILDSNIPVIEANIAVYDSSKSYKTLDIVQIDDRKYQAVQDVPAATNPKNDVNPTTLRGTYWFDMGATNYAKSFDELDSAGCINNESIYYKFKTSDVDLLMLVGLKAKIVRIKVDRVDEDEAITLMDETFTTTNRNVADWFDWTYQTNEYSSTFIKRLTMSYDTTLEIWIDEPDEIVKVSHIVFGRSKDYGFTMVNPKPIVSRRSIKAKTRGADGNIVTRRKARYKRMKVTCAIPENRIDSIEDSMESIVDTPCIFMGDEKDGGIKALSIYGEVKDHDMPIGLHSTTYVLEIEGYLQ